MFPRHSLARAHNCPCLYIWGTCPLPHTKKLATLQAKRPQLFSAANSNDCQMKLIRKCSVLFVPETERVIQVELLFLFKLT